MEQPSQQKIELIPENNLFSDSFLYYAVFFGLFFFWTHNWVYALVYAIFPWGIISHLCNNKPASSIGYLTAFPFVFLWTLISTPLTEKIIHAIRAGSENATVMQICNDITRFMPVPGKMSAAEILIFVLGASIFRSAALKLSTLIPEKVKMSGKGHIITVFASREIGQLTAALCVSYFLRWGLQKIEIESYLPFLLCLFPPIFALNTWKKAVRDVTEWNAVNAQENNVQKIKAMKIPDLKLADVAGMEKIKQQITLRMIEPIRNPKLAEQHGIKPGGGVMLYGPPGTGKTYIAKAVAGELKIPFYTITAADIFAKYVGDSEKSVVNIFKEIRQNKLAVLFIDEMETIFHKRTDEIHETTRKIISVILQELDGIDSHNTGILFIGATNTPHMIDEAFLRTGRFDVQIYVGLPDRAARLQIINSCFSDVKYPIAPGLFDSLADCTEEFSGADLKGLATKIKQHAYSVHATSYTFELFQECLMDAKPSSNAELMKQIHQWEQQRAR